MGIHGKLDLEGSHSYGVIEQADQKLDFPARGWVMEL